MEKVYIIFENHNQELTSMFIFSPMLIVLLLRFLRLILLRSLLLLLSCFSMFLSSLLPPFFLFSLLSLFLQDYMSAQLFYTTANWKPYSHHSQTSKCTVKISRGGEGVLTAACSLSPFLSAASALALASFSFCSFCSADASSFCSSASCFSGLVLLLCCSSMMRDFTGVEWTKLLSARSSVTGRVMVLEPT